MICNKCFAEIPDDSKVCPFCGAAVEAEEAPAEEVLAEEAPAQATPVEAAPAVAPVVTPAVSFEPAAEPKKAKKGGKKLLTIGLPIAAVVTAAAVLVATNFGFIKGKFIKWFKSDAEYVSFVETENMKNATNDVVELYRTLYDNLGTELEGNYNAEVEVTVGDELKSLFSQYVLGSPSATNYFDFFQKANLKMNLNAKDGNLRLEGFVGVNGTNILSANVIQTAEGEMYLQVPELSSKYLYADAAGSMGGGVSVQDMLTTLDGEELKEVLPDPDLLEKVLNRYFKVAFDTIDDVDAEKVTLKIDSISQDCDAYSIEISEKMLINMAIAVLEEAKDDEDLKEIIMPVVEFVFISAGAYSSEIEDSIDDGLDDAIDELKEYRSEASREAVMILTDYVDGSHNIIGRSITFTEAIDDEVAFNIYSVEDGKDYGMKFEIVGVEGAGFCFKATGTKSGDKLTVKGGLEVNIVGMSNSLAPDGSIQSTETRSQKMEVLNFSTKDLDTELLKEGIFKGTITLSPGDDLLNELASEGDIPTSVASLLALQVELVGNGSEDATDTTINILLAGKKALGIRLTASEGDPADIAVPSKGECIDATSSEALEAWMQDMNPQVLLDKLEAIGFPTELLEDGMAGEPTVDDYYNGYYNDYYGY